MIGLVLEAAIRSLLMACVVWGTMRLLRVHHVIAQKVAWVLVLLAAVAMPLVMRAPFFAGKQLVGIPLLSFPSASLPSPAESRFKANASPAIRHPELSLSRPSIEVIAGHFSSLPKRPAAHSPHAARSRIPPSGSAP